jgi:hypothetical protein
MSAWPNHLALHLRVKNSDEDLQLLSFYDRSIAQNVEVELRARLALPGDIELSLQQDGLPLTAHHVLLSVDITFSFPGQVR